jgi:hypothetical protein
MLLYIIQAEEIMSGKRRIAFGSCLLGMIVFVAGCVVEPHDGYYDRDHHRYYHEHTWHECVEHDTYCH